MPEVDFWQQRDDDFDESDRPMIYPSDAYGKHIYPVKRQSQPDVAPRDWEYVTPKYIPFVGPDAESKQKHPLFAVTWMKGGKYLLTGTSSGDII